MKPLLKNTLDSFLKRFGNFIDAEIRSIDATSPTTISAVIACQDSARGFDWLTINFEFCGVIDASLIQNSKLRFIDMSSGLDITYRDGSFVFSINNATIFIKSSTIKYEEGLF